MNEEKDPAKKLTPPLELQFDKVDERLTEKPTEPADTVISSPIQHAINGGQSGLTVEPAQPNSIVEELKLDGFVDERSLILNPVFVDGFAAGWHFAVPESFKDAFDIKWGPRVIKGKSRQVYTQGRNFSFKLGDVFYDNKAAYLCSWGDALLRIKKCVKITSATSASIVVSKTFETAEVNYAEDKVPAGSAKITYQRTRLSTGSVSFEEYRPNSEGNALEVVAKHSTTQELFIYYLQTGELI